MQGRNIHLKLSFAKLKDQPILELHLIFQEYYQKESGFNIRE
jgi:hypothetical protein